MALGSLSALGVQEARLAQGNDAAAGSRRGRSFARLEELCLKAAGTPPATFWGVFYGFVCWGAGVDPVRKSDWIFGPIRLPLLVGEDSSGSYAVKDISLEAL